MGYYTVYSDELYHYGVLGMKWGVRRTPAQLARAAGRKIASGASKAARSIQAAHIESRMGKVNSKRVKNQYKYDKYVYKTKLKNSKDKSKFKEASEVDQFKEKLKAKKIKDSYKQKEAELNKKYEALDKLRDSKISDLSEKQINAGRVAYTTAKAVGQISMTVASTAFAGSSAGTAAWNSVMAASKGVAGLSITSYPGHVTTIATGAEAIKVLAKADKAQNIAGGLATAGSLVVTGGASYATRNQIKKSGKKKKD